MTTAELEQLADLVAERVLARLADVDTSSRSSSLIDAHEAGRRLGRSATWVRRHADQLGAVRLGDGPRPRLAFDPEQIAEHVAARCTRERSTDHEPPAHGDAPAPAATAPLAPRLHAVPDLGDDLTFDPAEGRGVPSWR
jgi:hypothetical protein